MKRKILITTGGSGGHVVPALTFYEHLKDDFDIFLSSDYRGSKFIDNKIYNFEIINVLPLTKNIILLPKNIILFIFAILKSLIFLKKNKINIIISTGGYMSLPVCFAAKVLNLKIILFEPNMVIGRSNLFLLNKCSLVICYSKKILNFPNKYENKIKLIPPIIRKQIYFEKKNENYNLQNKIKILIIGGSQGADFFQTNLKDPILKLSKKFHLEILHQVNKTNKQNLENFYKENNIKYNLFDYKDDLYKSNSDINLCITRAGASSLAELVHSNIPFIAVPFPHAKDNHQFYNALFYKNLNCCWMIEQSSNFINEIDNLITSIIVNKNDIYKKIDAMKKISYENSWNNINQKLINTINEN